MEGRFIILPALFLITDVIKNNVGFRATSTFYTPGDSGRASFECPGKCCGRLAVKRWAAEPLGIECQATDFLRGGSSLVLAQP